jgi:hypothetical protein
LRAGTPAAAAAGVRFRDRNDRAASATESFCRDRNDDLARAKADAVVELCRERNDLVDRNTGVDVPLLAIPAHIIAAV